MKLSRDQERGLSMFRIAFQAMGLLILLPTLVIVYLFKENLNLQKIEVLTCLLVAASNLKRTVQIQDSQLQEAQLKINQSEKLSALGQLAGGVAHDFNNLLQAVQGYVMLSMSLCQQDCTLIHHLHQIRMAAERAALLASQLLAFGRRQVLKPRNLDLNRVIEELLKMLERVIGEHISLQVIPNSQGIVRADPHQIEQVLMNLCVNSRDAMPNGGNMAIETKHLEVGPSGSDQFPGVAPGRFVLMSVKDSGCGMDKETLKHIFEPFFTTKEVGKGTGQGLAISHSVIVKRHGGTIDFESKLGEGTTFVIKLSIEVGDLDEKENSFRR